MSLEQHREAVTQRAGARCEYCRVPACTQVAPYHLDHVIPQSLGGLTVLENLALACGWCNTYKAAHTEGTDPETGATVPLFHPRQDVWEEHFQWSPQDAALLEGKTPKGRATIERLRMNDPHIVGARRWLRRFEAEFEG